MLASTGPTPSAASAWAVEPKLDGWRVLVYVDDVVDVRTRNGRAIGDRVPELAGLSEALGGRSAILDGELVVGQGQPDDFYRLGPAWRRIVALPSVAGRPLRPSTWRCSI